MTALIVFLGFAGAACGLVAVAAMVQQRMTASSLQQRLGSQIVIDGGNAAGVHEETPHHLDVLICDMVANQRPGLVAIIFAALGAAFALTASVLGLIGS